MGIVAGGNSQVGVPELLSNEGKGGTALRQQRSVCMTKDVEADRRVDRLGATPRP